MLTNKRELLVSISILVNMDLSLFSDHTSLLPLWESQREWLTPAADGKWDHLTGAELLLGGDVTFLLLFPNA